MSIKNIKIRSIIYLSFYKMANFWLYYSSAHSGVLFFMISWCLSCDSFYTAALKEFPSTLALFVFLFYPRKLKRFKKKFIHKQTLACLQNEFQTFKHKSLDQKVFNNTAKRLTDGASIFCDSLFGVKCLCTSFGTSSRCSPCQSLNIFISIKWLLVKLWI